MKKRILCVMLAVVITLFAAMPAFADGGFDKDVVNSVAVVYSNIVYQGQYIGSSFGTGFFIGKEGKDPEYMITNYHVIEDFVLTGGGSGESELYVLYEADDMEEVYVVDYDAEKDFALLRLDKPTDKRKALVMETPGNMVGDQVYAVGYPAIADSVVDALSFFGNNDATVTGGHVSRLVTESGTGRHLLQTDATVHSGNSGGPLVNTNGHVVGINTFVLVDANGTEITGVYYAVSIEEILPMLDRNNVPYDIDTDDNMLLWIIIGAAALVLVLVIVLVLVLVLTRKGKKTPATPPVAPPQAPQQPAVRSMASQHGGRHALIGAQPLTIGRDASVCQISYMPGTPGVSGRHCTVAWDPATKCFLLTDLRSTYGTFLIGGQKLNPGVPYRLQPGDSFYLGDRSNELRVELV